MFFFYKQIKYSNICFQGVANVRNALKESVKEVVQEDVKAGEKVIESAQNAGKQVVTAVKDKITAIRKVIETPAKTIIVAAGKLAVETTPKP